MIVVIICGIMYMAMPLSIVGSNFTAVWADKDKLLLLNKTKQRLADHGFAQEDVKSAFEFFDRSGDNEVDFGEFEAMIDMLRLGLSKRRVTELFQAFDTDYCGYISYPEFCKTMFPDADLTELSADHEDAKSNDHDIEEEREEMLQDCTKDLVEDVGKIRNQVEQITTVLLTMANHFSVDWRSDGLEDALMQLDTVPRLKTRSQARSSSKPMSGPGGVAIAPLPEEDASGQ